jgi:hypothetical protein
MKPRKHWVLKNDHWQLHIGVAISRVARRAGEDKQLQRLQSTK